MKLKIVLKRLRVCSIPIERHLAVKPQMKCQEFGTMVQGEFSKTLKVLYRNKTKGVRPQPSGTLHKVQSNPVEGCRPDLRAMELSLRTLEEYDM